MHRLGISAAAINDARVLTVEGVLDSGSYLALRNAITEAALDQPPLLIVDVTGLCVPSRSAWAVLSSAHWHVSRSWPHVPLVAVCTHAAGRDALADSGVTRFVPVYAGVEFAIEALPGRGARRYRRQTRAELAAEPASMARARELVTDWLPCYRSELIAVASVVVTVLVENALPHTNSALQLTVETDGATVTIAVRDTSTALPARREDTGGRVDHLAGLSLLTVLCTAWGTVPTTAGKTVWAVIDAARCA